MDSLHTRLLNAYDKLRAVGLIHTQSQFAEALGKTRSQVSAAFNDAPKRCTLGLMKTICRAFPDVINENYMMTGEGSIDVPPRSVRPHFTARASAGFMDGISVGETGEPRTVVPELAEYDFTIQVQGDSMLPLIEDGDILACRILEDRTYIPTGRICVLDTIDGAIVKKVINISDANILLHSENPIYPDFDLPAEDVYKIAEVVGLIRNI